MTVVRNKFPLKVKNSVKAVLNDCFDCNKTQPTEYEIPAKIADKIEDNNYLILQDHVVWSDYSALQVLDKNTGEEKSIHAPGMNGLNKIAAYDE